MTTSNSDEKVFIQNKPCTLSKVRFKDEAVPSQNSINVANPTTKTRTTPATAPNLPNYLYSDAFLYVLSKMITKTLLASLTIKVELPVEIVPKKNIRNDRF